MDQNKLFTAAINQATSTISEVLVDQLTNDTPCTDWNLKALINHIVYETLWVPDLLDGKTVAEVGTKYDGDVLGANFKEAWSSAATKAQAAVKQAAAGDTVHLSYADVSAKNYVYEIAGDILLHTWDVAQSIGKNLVFDPDVTRVLYDAIYPRREEFAASGMFGKPLEIDPESDLQAKLLALVGRKAN